MNGSNDNRFPGNQPPRSPSPEETLPGETVDQVNLATFVEMERFLKSQEHQLLRPDVERARATLTGASDAVLRTYLERGGKAYWSHNLPFYQALLEVLKEKGLVK